MRDQPTRESTNDQSIAQVKATIIEEARRGAFDHNPLLSTVHTITCPHCQQPHNIVYLTYLKQGVFEVGKTQHVETLDTSGPIGIMEKQQVSPIIISLQCADCDVEMEVRPVSVEYLSVLLNRPRPSRALYA
jgi:hypothetical protein